MLIRLLQSRFLASVLAAVITGLWVRSQLPFPADDLLLNHVRLRSPHVYQGIRTTYEILCFTTPLIVINSLSSLAFIFVRGTRKAVRSGKLPRYPEPTKRERLELYLGEVHHRHKTGASRDPRWLVLPERGLYTGMAVFGAIGTGKTSCCMYPYAEQLLAFAHDDPERRIGGLVLEVKGDFCHKVRSLLARCGRGEDYVEVGLESEFRYNPLHNDLEPYALAYTIASLLNAVYGRGKEPFWQQAYTNLVKFVILLHKVLDGYVTLFDVYRSVIDSDYLTRRIETGRERFGPRRVRVAASDYYRHPSLKEFEFHAKGDSLLAEATPALLGRLEKDEIPYRPLRAEDADPHSAELFEAVERWYEHDWSKMHEKLRTSIVEGISVFLSLFDDSPQVKRVFCPPKECYQREHGNGRPLPPFSELIESGKVVALNFPVSLNPGLAKALGTLLKMDFQRAVLNRIPSMETQPDRHWRQVMFLCDEYQIFATSGESDPTGDEKFFSLSRQAKCIPLVASQSISSLRTALPGESWRTLLQAFRTKIFLSLADDFSAKVASDLCGRSEQLRPQYAISESSHSARVSFLTGRAASAKSSLTAGKSFALQRHPVFEPKVFTELPNAMSIVLAYDGINPHPPTLCCLKPYYRDPNTSYYRQLEKGEI